METKNTFEIVSHLDALVRRMGNEIDAVTVSLYSREAHVIAVNHERGTYSVHSFFWHDGEPLGSHLCWGHYDCGYDTSRAILREKSQRVLGGAA